MKKNSYANILLKLQNILLTNMFKKQLGGVKTQLNLKPGYRVFLLSFSDNL